MKTKPKALLLLPLVTLVLLVFVISSWASSSPLQSGIYRSKRNVLQNFAIERALKDKGFVRSLINCVLDRGPCDGHGRQLRLLAPEIVRGQCPGCSKKVHGQIRRVISHVQRNFPQEWSEVVRRFIQYPQQQFQTVFGYHNNNNNNQHNHPNHPPNHP